LGFEFAAAFRVALGSIKRNPLIYACRWEDIRRVNLRKFSYGLFYFVEEDAVVVLALLHGNRDLKKLVKTRKQTYH
jgi:plasmid stabilization system protein ParE